MKIEIGTTRIYPLKHASGISAEHETGAVELITPIRPIGITFNTKKDAEGAMSNASVRESGKVLIDYSVAVGATMWAFEQIIEGFQHTNPVKVIGGLAIYGIANGFGVPEISRHYHEALNFLKRKNDIKANMKSTPKT